MFFQGFINLIFDEDFVSKRSLVDPSSSQGAMTPAQKSHLIDHIHSPNKLINALNLRKTCVYV